MPPKKAEFMKFGVNKANLATLGQIGYSRNNP